MSRPMPHQRFKAWWLRRLIRRAIRRNDDAAVIRRYDALVKTETGC